MRIIEPNQLHRQPAPKRKRLSRRSSVLLVLVTLSGGLLWHAVDAQEQPAVQSKVTEQAAPPRYREFSDSEFRDLYISQDFSNTTKIVAPPVVTGSKKADTRIRALAERRGYMLSSSPGKPLSKTEEGYFVQQQMLSAWRQLKSAAAKDGVNLGLVSAYRSVEEQRLLFMQELEAKAVSVQDIAAGLADKAIDDVLQTTSIPGYSRHHTGYAVDFKCGDEDFNFFANTSCFKWISAKNYLNAKQSGWIPSYPPEVVDQGPDPEAWEYVWVGTEALLE